MLPSVYNYFEVGEPVPQFQEEIDAALTRENPRVYKADTLEELCANVDIDTETLVAEVEKFNGYVDAGFDADFMKTPEYLRKIQERRLSTCSARSSPSTTASAACASTSSPAPSAPTTSRSPVSTQVAPDAGSPGRAVLRRVGRARFHPALGSCLGLLGPLRHAANEYLA